MNKIDDITIMNAWMFPTVFADERNLKLTKQLIEICMNRKIESIQQASVEHHVKPRVNSHGTRFDVKFVGDKEIYIVELQLYRKSRVLPCIRKGGFFSTRRVVFIIEKNSCDFHMQF